MIIHQTSTATETRKKARELYLKRQRSKLIDQIKGASIAEKKSVIGNIDSFLESVTPDGKTFWLKVRREIEREIERQLKSERSDQPAKMKRGNEQASKLLSFPQPFNQKK